MSDTATTLMLTPGLTSWFHLPARSSGKNAAAVHDDAETRQQIKAVLREQAVRRSDLNLPAGQDSVTDRDADLDVLVDACIEISRSAPGVETFLATGLPATDPILATLRVTPQLRDDPDYLFEVAGALDPGSVRPPTVETLPAEFDDGISVLRLDDLPGESIVASLTVARRAWEHDIVVAVRTFDLGIIPEAADAILELLGSVRPVVPQPAVPVAS
ncbi:hypothetical protein [Cryobacterium sp. SO1]|uniref:hypothetical protein n=1 Tax=Cryobacterium sp. SO1 TaxID=1897061 RepID=UPI0010236B78|nr:hypothetical protein [Cryobacterium sp. SO1]RZI34298.1 hypothetical protein BJQ95_03439 [Cryobacterium sp. SO1]